MSRVVQRLVLLGVVFSLSAAEASAAEIAGWGRVVDVEGDCRVEERNGALAISAPGEYRDLVAFTTLKNTTAPRVLQAADGDFTLQATARKFPLPAPKTPASSQNPTSYVGSGLLVWEDADTFLRLQRAANGDSKSGVAPFIHANQFAEGKMIANTIIRLPNDQDTHLRIERRGGLCAVAYSDDGRTWQTVELKGSPRPLAGDVQVGVFIINSTNRAITHEVADLRLTR